MLFGISTKVLRDYPLEDAIYIAADQGYQAIELWVDDVHQLHPDRIIQLTDRLGLTRTVHLLTEDLNIASFNPGIRKESLRQQAEGLRCAAQLGAGAATLHPGRKTAKTRTMEEAWACQTEAVRELAWVAGELGVTLCVEGMEKLNGEFILSCEDLAALLARCDVPGLSVTLDIAHLHTLGNVQTLLQQAKALPVGNVHISQSRGSKPHLTLFDPAGEIDCRGALAVLDTFYQKTVIVEGYVSGQGLEIARRSIRQLETMLEDRI